MTTCPIITVVDQQCGHEFPPYGSAWPYVPPCRFDRRGLSRSSRLVGLFSGDLVARSPHGLSRRRLNRLSRLADLLDGRARKSFMGLAMGTLFLGTQQVMIHMVPDPSYGNLSIFFASYAELSVLYDAETLSYHDGSNSDRDAFPPRLRHARRWSWPSWLVAISPPSTTWSSQGWSTAGETSSSMCSARTRT